jgi:CheY-like chemotaxis protein
LVLVADRNADRLASYQESLMQGQCVVVPVTTVDDCRAMLEEFTPDVLVLESELPDAARLLDALVQQPIAAALGVLMQSSAGWSNCPPALVGFARHEQWGHLLTPRS